MSVQTRPASNRIQDPLTNQQLTRRLYGIDNNGSGSGSAHVLDLNRPRDCPADMDGNGLVGFEDLTAILATRGNKGGPEDLDESGSVDVGDILVVLGSRGSCE